MSERAEIEAAVVLAAIAGGWSVRRVCRSPRSSYVQLRHAVRGRGCVRISDHGSGEFKPDGRSTWSIRLGRRSLAACLDWVCRRLADPKFS